MNPHRQAASLVACAVYTLLSAAGVGAQEPLQGRATVDLDRVINPAVIGGGVNFAFSDYSYIHFPTGGEWTDIHSQHLPYPDDAEEWGNFIRLMDFAGFQYVRLEVGMTQWEPVNDDDDPHHLNLRDGFVFSPGFADAHPRVDANNRIHMDLLHRLLSHWDDRGLFVVLGNWWAGPSTFCPGGDNWLLARGPDGKPFNYQDRTAMGVGDLEEFTESLAAIMYHLKVEQPHPCVEGISFWNEPEQMSEYYRVLDSVYTSLAKQLELNGIRELVKIQAFDGACLWNREMGGVADGVARLLATTDEHVDIISAHDYNSTFDYREGQRAPNVHGTISQYTIKRLALPVLEQIRQGDADGNIEPFVIGEFGSFALSGADTATATYEQRLHSAEGAIQLLNHGAKAIAYWVYNNNHHAQWRMLTFDEEDRGHFVPENANYYPLALTMKYIQRGSDIVQSSLEGLRDDAGHARVFLTVAKKGEDITLLWVNDSNLEARVTVTGVLQKTAFRQLYITERAYDGITEAGERALSEEAELVLRPRSITVLTTYGYGGSTAE